MDRVLLLCMPFAALSRPALGISLLKAALQREGIPCDIRYPNFTFAEYAGSDDYQWLNHDVPYTAWAGEWVFTPALYGPRPEVDRAYVAKIFQGIWGLGQGEIRRIERLRTWIAPFLDHCMATIPWDAYSIVGLTSTFEQNIASLALAQRVKTAYPHITIILGGANWEGEMGEELHQQFPFVDYVCSGEGERSFPALVQALATADPAALEDAIPPGIVYRREGRTVTKGPAPLIRDLDTLPVPDYSDYFEQLSESTIGFSILPVLLLETARGCWWGAKNQCTFCGLNGANLAFRSKSPERALAELEELAGRWRAELVEVVDNMLDMRYFDTVLPQLARRSLPLHLFYEVKANLSREQVALLKAAGVDHIQPGIESLNDHVLGLMRKGTTALRNIQMLKWCKEYGIVADWNLLYGFPGEAQEDYDATLALLPSLCHLTHAPTAGPMRMDRFSTYFNAPEAFGLMHVRPMAPYRYLYPFDEAALMRIAYCFDYDYAPEVDPRGFAQRVAAAVADWKQHPETGTLLAVERPDGALVLRDTRSVATVRELVLTGMERTAYEYCDAVRSGAAVIRRLRETYPDLNFDDDRVIGFLDSLVANRLMASDGKHYLSLALPVPAVWEQGACAPGMGAAG